MTVERNRITLPAGEPSGSGKQVTREELIEAGLGFVRSAGYTPTGIDQVLEIARWRSFSSHFATKDEFVLEVTRRYAAGEQERLERILNDSNVSSLMKLRLYFEESVSSCGRDGGPIAGCLLSHLTLEVARQNIEIRTLLRSAFDVWQNAIVRTIQEAIDEQELPQSANANDLAAVLVDSWQGAQIRATTDQSDKSLNLFIDNAFNVLL